MKVFGRQDKLTKKKNNLRTRKPKKERINKSDTNESKIDDKTLENAIHNQLKSERNFGKNDTMIDTDLKKETTGKTKKSKENKSETGSVVDKISKRLREKTPIKGLNFKDVKGESNNIHCKLEKSITNKVAIIEKLKKISESNTEDNPTKAQERTESIQKNQKIKEPKWKKGEKGIYICKVCERDCGNKINFRAP